MEGLSVTEALQQTQKGKLKKNILSLEDYNPFPSLSPEITNLLSKRVEHNTTEIHDDPNTTEIHDNPNTTGIHDDPNTTGIHDDPNTTGIHDDPNTKHVYAAGSALYSKIIDEQSIKGKMGKDQHSLFDDFSAVVEVNRELVKCEQSLDDRLLEEANKHVKQIRELFGKKLREISEKHEEESKKQAEERRRKLKQEQEDRRLKEKHMNLVYEEWECKTIERYKIEDEEVEARLISGEQQAKKIMMLREERRRSALCREYQDKCQILIRDLSDCKKSCLYPQHLPASVVDGCNSAIENIKAIYNNLGLSVAISDENQIYTLRDQLKGLDPVLEQMKTAVREADRLGNEQAKTVREELFRQKALMEKKAEDEKEKNRKLAEGQMQLQQEQKVEVQTQGQTVSLPVPAKDKDGLELDMSKSVTSLYTKLQDLLLNTSSSTNNLSSSKDPNIKRYRFELQRVASGTVNSISATSGEELMEKIITLRSLIGGQSVDVMGKSISIGGHSEARLYCCNLLAKKLVNQGENQISVNIEAAFPFAAVAIGLWSKFPEIGDLLLAHFHSVCPILVPLYIRNSGVTAVEYMKLQGFKVSSDGVVETEDKFLRRMRGFVRLYAAIISSSPLPFEQLQCHPHGLDHGWAWLSRILNMEPHPTLTATALGDFLEVAGFAMMKRFGRQFKKLLYVLCKEFVPKMEKCTPPSQRGPISRLTQFLQECISSGSFAEPKGYLHKEFWRTKFKGIACA